MINIIKINGKSYQLPTNPKDLSSVLNHIDMVRKGLKHFAKLFDLDGNEHKISTFELDGANIKKIIH